MAQAPTATTKPKHVAAPPNVPLPGGINVAFFDGHQELVALDKLWKLEWHRNYKAPGRRPGLR